MGNEIAEVDLFHACRILFGPGQDSPDFLKCVQRSGVKRAYRQRALETHPDRAAGYGSVKGSDQFVAVHRAYMLLSSFLSSREKDSCFSVEKESATRRDHPAEQYAWRVYASGRTRKKNGPSGRTSAAEPGARKPGPNATPWDIDSLYSGEMPSRPLMFGHFLYYSGRASWRTIVQALIWQRLQRPRFGEIGRRFGWLSEDDVTSLVSRRGTGIPIGQAAVQGGLLNTAQLNLIVSRQKYLQRKFGEYFLEKQLFSSEALAQLISRNKEHNAVFS